MSQELISNVNVTKLKEETIKEVPALCKQKNGKFV